MTNETETNAEPTPMDERHRQLAKRVIWALKFLKSNSTGDVCEFNAETGEVKPLGCWEEWFMDALDGVGYHVDRKEFWKRRDAKKRKGARRG